MWLKVVLMRRPEYIGHSLVHSLHISCLVCIKEVAIRTTFYCWNNLLHLQHSYWHSMYSSQKCLQQTIFNELCVKITLLRYIPRKNITICNAVYFRLCIDRMHITPPVIRGIWRLSSPEVCRKLLNTDEVRCRYGIGRVVASGAYPM